MEEFYKIFDYLPLSFKSLDEGEYLDFLRESFEVNYSQKKYQFAFIALHLLYMSFVFIKIWQLKKNYGSDFNNALVGFPREEVAMNGIKNPSPFLFSIINERRIFRFFRLIGCDDNDIKRFRESVDTRNSASHPNGQIIIKDRNTLDNRINNILTCVEEIHSLSENTIKDIYRLFLTDSRKPEKREYFDNENQIKEILIHGNYLSNKDLDCCMGFKINTLGRYKDFMEIENIHNHLADSYNHNDIE